MSHVITMPRAIYIYIYISHVTYMLIFCHICIICHIYVAIECEKIFTYIHKVNNNIYK